MYPELKKAGGLPIALNIELVKINSKFRVSDDDDLGKLPVTYARVQNGNKFSEVCIAAKEKLYLTDFWRDGVCLANASTNNIADLAKVVNFWLDQNASTQELADQYSFVKLKGKAKAFDENNEVEYTWNCLLLDDGLNLHEFVNLASKDDVVNKLFPFTSLYTLCFSRCTGYPYDTYNLPNVTPKQFEQFVNRQYRNQEVVVNNSQTLESLFVVTKNKNEYLGEGNAEEALKIVKSNLPFDIKPAIKGTAEDIL